MAQNLTVILRAHYQDSNMCQHRQVRYVHRLVTHTEKLSSAQTCKRFLMKRCRKIVLLLMEPFCLYTGADFFSPTTWQIHHYLAKAPVP